MYLFYKHAKLVLSLTISFFLAFSFLLSFFGQKVPIIYIFLILFLNLLTVRCNNWTIENEFLKINLKSKSVLLPGCVLRSAFHLFPCDVSYIPTTYCSRWDILDWPSSTRECHEMSALNEAKAGEGERSWVQGLLAKDCLLKFSLPFSNNLGALRNINQPKAKDSGLP